MPKTIIADTSCFIVLDNIGELELLFQLYGEVTTTPDIANEYGEPLPAWVKIVPVVNTYRQHLLELQIDKGESSAIALALETQNSTVILDDYKARKIAKRLNIDFTGTIGIIIKAKLKGIIASIKPILYKINQTDFYLSNDIEQQALKEANE